MCLDPASIAAISTFAAANAGTIATVSAVASAGVTAYSQVKNNRAIEAGAKATAKAQDKAALDAIESGDQQSDLRRRAAAQTAAENTTGLAANGVDLDSSAALDLLDDNKQIVEEDAFTIRENARKQGGQFAQQAANSRAQANTAGSAAFFQPIGTALTAGASVGAKYAGWARDNQAAQGAF